MIRSACFLLVLPFYALLVGPLVAAQLESLDPARQWRVRNIDFIGNQRFSDRRLSSAIITQARPWFRFWGQRPEFDPITFETDLERLRRFYETQGYYNSRITYDLEVNQSDGLVSARIQIDEDRPVLVSEVNVDIPPSPQEESHPGLPRELPLQRGDIFVEEKYQNTEQVIRGFFLESGYAHVETERRAQVFSDKYDAHVWYFAQPGPQSFFGATEVTGTRHVEPHLIRRELAYDPGEIFSLRKIRESRQRILSLDLFSSVQINPKEVSGKPTVVPMEISVSERPPREISFGLGYNTEEDFRVSLNWHHRNWLGGGRRLSVTGAYSSIVATGGIEFRQPHFLNRHTQGALALRYDQEREDTYLRNAGGFLGRIQHNFNANLVGSLGYRFQYNQLNNIDPATVAALGDIRSEGLVSGPSIGLVWTRTDDPLSPTLGEVVSLSAEQSGAVWPGRYSFYRLVADARKYLGIGWETVLAGRLRFGMGDAIGADRNFPLFERFYSGGQNSVRGYERRRLGPLSAADEPLGGLSLIEGSLELRRPIWEALGGALFLDFGQVSLRSFDIPVSDLRFSAGFGLSYTTPVGPMRLDIGFPFKPPPGDQAWQIHFSIGAFF
jgi:outer membrane protein assembly complex protein YaeT